MELITLMIIKKHTVKYLNHKEVKKIENIYAHEWTAIKTSLKWRTLTIEYKHTPNHLEISLKNQNIL